MLDERKRKVLKEYFGHDAFRVGQEEIIDAVLSGRNVLCVMPTGAGKSVCFQIPALLFEGITLVISPLVSLMKDQTSALVQNGIAAAFINNSLTDNQLSLVFERAALGAYKIIYVAPERLNSFRFTQLCKNSVVSLIAVDEAHCVSQWGQDFRPSYTLIKSFIQSLPTVPPIAAFTATATPKVREDIVKILNLKNPLIKVTGFNRENLYFEVRKPKHKFEELIKILSRKRDAFGIIYCSTKKTVDVVAEKLLAERYSVTRYHAGLTKQERTENQEDFIFDRKHVMVATNAFGMGIDKSNVGFVIHYNMPKDLESYYQEAGRAGRDGSKAECILLYSGQDLMTAIYLIEHGDKVYDSAETEQFLKEAERKRLKTMENYCKTDKCLRSTMLSYFGESGLEACGDCGNCNSETERVDVTEIAQKILACVESTGERFGRQMVLDVLRGSKSEKILRYRLERLNEYGCCQVSAVRIREVMDFLTEEGILKQSQGEYPLLLKGSNFVSGRSGTEKLFMRRLKAEETVARKKPNAALPISDENTALFHQLKKVRSEIAKKQNLPPFVIFHDSTLLQMSALMPQNKMELLKISGVGCVKADKYGEQFLSCICDFSKTKNCVAATVSDSFTLQPEKPEAIFSGYSGGSVTQTSADFSQWETSSDDVTVSVIADRINCMLLKSGRNTLTARTINDWLTVQGYLLTSKVSEKKIERRVSKSGYEGGLFEELRKPDNREEYIVVYFTPKMQQIVKNRIYELLDYAKVL